MSKHTPGPWAVYSTAKDKGMTPYFGVDGGDGSAVVLWDESGGILSHADARLIASAPDLLDALQSLCADELHTQDKWDAARAAIAKATGND